MRSEREGDEDRSRKNGVMTTVDGEGRGRTSRARVGRTRLHRLGIFEGRWLFFMLDYDTH